jgi:hypothetical protein
MLNFLFVILIIYVVIVILFRFVFPFLLKRFVNRLQRNIFNQNNDFQQKEYQSKKKGDINVDYIPPKSNSNTNNVGEYVDYEEIN